MTDERIIHDVSARGLKSPAITICVEKGKTIEVYIEKGISYIDFDVKVKCYNIKNGKKDLVSEIIADLATRSRIKKDGTTIDYGTDWIVIETVFGTIGASWENVFDEEKGWYRDHKSFEVRFKKE